MAEGWLAHVVFTITDESEEDSDRKLAEVEDLVSSVPGVKAVVGEFYPGD